MKRVLVGLILAVAFGILVFLWAYQKPSVMGVWEGTDEFGHEHFFEFHPDGTLSWWDRDRSAEGSFTERPHFRGVYRWQDRKTVVTQTGGVPSEPLGTLTVLSEDQLKQSGGHSLRHNLVYRRIAGR